jgi:hypothetical protein
MMWPWLAALGLVLSVVVLVILTWHPLRRFGGAVQVERAKELFLLQRERLEPLFLEAAAASGKPRGLLWKETAFESELAFARDKATRQVVALVGVTIRFEAVAGSDMEGLPAVANLRNASAVFFFQRGQWQTTGKAVFNLNPAEALHHFRNHYEPIASDHDRRIISS